MSRQRPDALETRQDLGPLFTPRLRELAHTADPFTSVAAAAEVIASGKLRRDQEEALELVLAHPGSTAPELGAIACRPGEDPEHARQRIGRRLSELTNPPGGPGFKVGKGHHIERRGRRDGCACWWPVGEGGGR
jgi:hypothetical protein